MKKEDFAQLVNLSMGNAEFTNMRPVVEKELLHYEIFNALDEAGLLKNLVFQGGTSLRLCRGSDRFSEDLDFAGGKDFSLAGMEKIKECIECRIGSRFGLKVVVKEPKSEKGRGLVAVDKWWIAIETAPGNPAMPKQKIKLEIASIPAYTRELVPLRINYQALEGRPQVLVNAETLDEVLADKIVALPTSISAFVDGKQVSTPTKIRHRDIWDIAWLVGKGAALNAELVNKKILDYGIEDYGALVDFAMKAIPEVAAGAAFKTQMKRFIKDSAYKQAFGRDGFEGYLASTVNQLFQEMRPSLATFETKNLASSRRSQPLS